MALGVKFLGVRGSLPTPHSPDILDQRIEKALFGFFKAGYTREDQIETYMSSLDPSKKGGMGGNTSCTQVYSEDTTLLIDAGTGIRPYGYELLAGPCGKGQGSIHILMTHFHWDHLIGLPFFVPIYVPGNEINFYTVEDHLEETIRGIFKRPFFPVAFENLKAKINFHRLEPRKTFRLGDLDIAPYLLDHPDPCWGYKISHKGKVFSYCSDTECTRMSRAAMGADLPLYQGVDLMAFDAQYTLSQTLEKENWGHSAATIGLDIAIREGIRKVMFIHHDPGASDEAIRASEDQTRRYHEKLIQNHKSKGTIPANVEWAFAREGTLILL